MGVKMGIFSKENHDVGSGPDSIKRTPLSGWDCAKRVATTIPDEPAPTRKLFSTFW